MKMHFTMYLGKISIQVFGTSQRTQKDQIISRLEVENFNCEFEQKAYSQNGTFSLHQIYIRDEIEATQIIHSPEDKNFIECTYCNLTKKHPSYRDTDARISITICGLNLMYDPNYVRDMLTYSMEKFKSFYYFYQIELEKFTEKLGKQDSEAETSEESSENQDDTVGVNYDKVAANLIKQAQSAGPINITEKRILVDLRLSIGTCSISLKKQNSQELLAKLIFNGCTLGYIQYSHVKCLNIVTGGIQLYDMFEQTKHNEIIMTPPTQEAVELNIFLLDKQARDF